jgi:hypothetical protein
MPEQEGEVMGSQLIPRQGMDPLGVRHLTSEQRFALWAEYMDLAHEMLMAGLRRKVGPSGDVEDAYRGWYERQMENHDAMMRKMAENLYQRGVRHGR